MNVFVLGTGRCGSVTFSKACQHITNYTSGHETRWGHKGASRLTFRDKHIEVDNRLSWHLGELGAMYPDAFFVHLVRDREATAKSFATRWRIDPPYRYRSAPRGFRRLIRRFESSGSRPGIIEAYAYSVLGRNRPWEHRERLDVCRAYVDTVNSNIQEFLKDRDSLEVRLEQAAEAFDTFWERLGAEGDATAAIAELQRPYNASAS